jgi:predicted transcriptional regulator
MTYEEIALEKIGKAIDICMKERKINIQQLETLSGVSRTIIYKILRGQSYQISSLIRVMRYLQVHIELSLMSEDNNIMTMGGHKPSQN